MPVCQWIQHTALSVFLRESTWGFPIVGAVHVLALAWFGGAVLVVDLRRLGMAFAGQTMSEVARQLRAWQGLGFAILTLSGGLLFWLEPVKCYESVAFWIKMALLAIAVVNFFNRTRPAAWISLIVWTAIIFASQAIGFG